MPVAIEDPIPGSLMTRLAHVTFDVAQRLVHGLELVEDE
jgi:hypothetical protein